MMKYCRASVLNPFHESEPHWRRLLVLLVLLGGVPQTATAQAPEVRVVTAVRLQATDRIVLDGRLTEETWRRATPASGFRQQDPNNGDAATEPTEVRILYDDHRIIVGVICFDSEPRRVMGNHMQRD